MNADYARLLPAHAAIATASLPLLAIPIGVAAVAVALAAAVAADLVRLALTVPVAVTASAVAAGLARRAVGGGTAAITGRLVLAAVIAADLEVVVAVDVPAARVPAIRNPHADAAATAKAGVAVVATAA